MENIIRRAFVSQKSAPNKRLAAIIARVDKKYGNKTAELDDDLLGLVSAAGEQDHRFSKKEEDDE